MKWGHFWSTRSPGDDRLGSGGFMPVFLSMIKSAHELGMTNETIGRYEIESELGHGGMATVYLAHDPRFRRKVAIKLVAVKLQDHMMFRERFEREAQLIAKIEHPAIVPVYDFGEQDGQPYLVMRYMPGGALSDRIKDGPMTLAEVSRIISQIAPGLDAVHAQGIVHRDLKPANILMDAFGNPAISDFGIAHFTQSTIDLTGSAIIGTPAYMSPEQVRGDEDLDARSDLYALAVIVFEMLTGSGPFRAATPMSVAMKHLTESVPSIRSFRPDLPVQLEFILNKALAKQPESRYDSASQLAQDLQAAEAAVPSSTPASAKLAPGEDTPTERYDDEPGVQSASPTTGGSLSPTRDGHSASFPQRSKQRPNNILRMVLVAALGVFMLFLCGSIGAFGTWAGLSGLFGQSSPTLPPTLAPTATKAAPAVLLFADDFSDPNSGWPTGQNETSEYGYQSNAYRIFAQGTNSIPWVSTDRVYDNLSLSVDARAISDSVSGYYGLLCRIQDDQSFYYFVISNGGGYSVGKYINGTFRSYLTEIWQPSAAIRQGALTNQLQMDCVGDSLRYYVNGILLTEITDTDFSSGYSGIVAASHNDQGFEALFDSFSIRRPNP